MNTDKKIATLLDDLNYWGRLKTGGNIADTGQIRAMVDNLKKKIARLGREVFWDGQRFVIKEKKEH